jgi:hypothetical protein
MHNKVPVKGMKEKEGKENRWKASGYKNDLFLLVPVVVSRLTFERSFPPHPLLAEHNTSHCCKKIIQIDNS